MAAPAPSGLATVQANAATVRLLCKGRATYDGFVRRAAVRNNALVDAFLSFDSGSLSKEVGAGPLVFELGAGQIAYLYIQDHQELYGSGGPANALRLSVHTWDEPMSGSSMDGVPG